MGHATIGTGSNYQLIDVGDNESITTTENGGAGLTGQNDQDSLNVGYRWNNVDNNTLGANEMLIIEGESTSGAHTYTTGVFRENSTSTHTAIGHVSSTADVTISGTRTKGGSNLGSQQVTATEEVGLTGQNISGSHASFSTGVGVVSAATYSSDTNTARANGEAISITDTGTGIYQNDVYISSTTVSNESDYTVSNGQAGSLNHGDRDILVEYLGNSAAPTVGQLSRIAKGTVAVNISDLANVSDIASDLGISLGTLHTGYNSNATTLNYKLETRFEAAAAATTGSQIATAGTDFGVNGLALRNTNTNTDSRFTGSDTSAELLDSSSLSEEKTVTLSFVALGNVAATSVDSVASLETAGSNAGSVAGMFQGNADKSLFVSDIVQLSGLDGELHVLEVGYDGSFAALQTLGNESAAQLVWGTTYDSGSDPAAEAWINAVLGNSNISNLDLLAGTLSVDSGLGLGLATITDYLALTRFAGSYEEYLADGSLTDPELGVWGVDVDSNQVWSVIDHNSDFAAAVPEPTTYALIAGVLALASTIVRRKKRA